MSPALVMDQGVRAPRPSFPIELLKGVLPQAVVDEGCDHATIAASSLKDLERLDAQLLTSTAVWRNLYALTGTLRTFNCPESILPVWQELFLAREPYDFVLQPMSSKISRLSPYQSWISAKFTFKTRHQPRTICSGHLGVVPDQHSPLRWKIWLITTMLENLEGYPGPDRILTAPCHSLTNEPMTGLTNGLTNDLTDGLTNGLTNGSTNGSTNGLTNGLTNGSTNDFSCNDSNSSANFDCVVIGAGFAGLCLAGRLKAMGMHYTVLERNANIGDNWLNRYDSARLHTSKYFSDFPFGGVFTDDDPFYLDSSSLARGFQEYVKKHSLSIRLSTSLKSASYDEDSKLWTINTMGAGKMETLQTKHMVLAVGIGGQILKMPQFSNPASFTGPVLHSGDYKNAHAWKGKRGVVIGTANTGHDVAADMVEAGLASVTMVQRSRTPVYAIEHYQKWSNMHYNKQSDTETSDRDILALPIAILRKLSMPATKAAVNLEHPRFDALERAGFKVERYCDIWKALIQFFGGHY